MNDPSARQINTRQSPLAILAGGGDFPMLVADATTRAGRPILIFGIIGEASDRIVDFPHVWLGRGQLGRLFRKMRTEGIKDLVFIGNMRQRRLPRLSEIDLGGLWCVLSNLRLLQRGDDGVLRKLASIIEAKGVRVVGAADVAPDLVVGAGVHTLVTPTDRDYQDITLGLAAARRLGAADRGQAAVAREGAVLIHEGADGTDAMLRAIPRESRDINALSGVLVKYLKPRQDPRLDMPAIGLNTVAAAAAAGLRGIAVGAETTLVTDLAAVVAELDRRGMFLIGLRQGGIAPGADRDTPL